MCDFVVLQEMRTFGPRRRERRGRRSRLAFSRRGLARAVGVSISIRWVMNAQCRQRFRCPPSGSATSAGRSPSPDWTSWTRYKYPSSMAQLPALRVSCKSTGTELPLGLQIVGPRHAHTLVLGWDWLNRRHRLALTHTETDCTPGGFGKRAGHRHVSQIGRDVHGATARWRRCARICRWAACAGRG